MKETAFSVKLIGFLSGFSGLGAYSAILAVLFACGLGVPIPEDISLIAAGILAGLGNISLLGGLLVGFIGVMAGDTFLFFMGRKYGHQVFKLPILRKIFTPHRIALGEAKVRNNSQFICFTARFLPGLRAPIFLSAGTMGVKPSTFFLLDGFAALISVPIWVVGGWYFAQNLDSAFEFLKKTQWYLFMAVGILILIYFIVKNIKKRGSLPSS